MNKYVILLYLALLPLSVFAQDVVYVQSLKAKLMSAPSFKSDIIAVFKQGDKMEVIERQNRWIKVHKNGTTGWLPKLLVAVNPPLKKTSVLTATEDDSQKKNVRRRASSTATAAAARGLKQDDRARMSDQERADWKALKKVESLQIDASEVTDFAPGTAGN